MSFNPTPTFEDSQSPKKTRCPEPQDLNMTTPVNIETSALIEDYSIEDSSEEEERGFNITLRKCDIARHEGEAVSPKAFSPNKKSRRREFESPDKLNYTSIGAETDGTNFDKSDVDCLMLASETISPKDFSKTLGQVGPKRSDRFNELETQSLLDTSLTVEQQERIEFLKMQRCNEMSDANSFSDAVDMNFSHANLLERKK